MALMIGTVLALTVGIFARTVRLDRDRAFYPTVMIVIASYYVLFAVMADSTQAIVLESLVGAGFVVATVWGFRSTLWIVAAALGAHGFLDLFHDVIIFNPGLPTWWPDWCLAYDVTAAIYLGWLLITGRLYARI